MTSEPARSEAPSIRLGPGQAGSPPQPEFGVLASAVVAAAVGITSLSFMIWWPFMPLYALELGAKNDADALFWVAVATSVQGIARLTSGPVWGVISDRYGRKVMFLRALFLSSTIGATAAFLSAPWQLAIPMGLAGLFSGFNPAAIALVSVSVPNSKLNSSLSMLTGAQYIGTTLGPAVGALMAVVLSYRGAILVASIVPLVTGLAVLLYVPRDQVGVRSQRSSLPGDKPDLEPFRISFQFVLAVLIYFMIFALNQLIRLITPVSLRSIQGDEDVAGLVGLTFSLGGLISAVSVLLVAPRFFKSGRLRVPLVASCAVAAGGFVIMAVSSFTLGFVAGFLVVAMIMSAITPTTGTLIAANSSRSRRGTAFGVAGSAQALALGAGPIAAAVFAAISLEWGFLALAALLLALGLLLQTALREPDLTDA
jgi:DHA1 family multidrug resistance protein-like MFS transporter